MKNLPIDGAIYVPAFLQFDNIPSWVRLYSILPGTKTAVCPVSESLRTEYSIRTISVIDCSGATSAQQSEFTAIMARVLDASEQRLGSILHVSHASYTLIPPGHAYTLRDTQRIRATRLRFKIAARFDPLDAAWSLSAARATAHEAYHIAMVASGHRETNPPFPEESRASIFASCVEHDVFGQIDVGTIESRSDVVTSSTAIEFVHQSEAGKQIASEALRNILGPDARVSSAIEKAEFQRLCAGMVD